MREESIFLGITNLRKTDISCSEDAKLYMIKLSGICDFATTSYSIYGKEAILYHVYHDCPPTPDYSLTCDWLYSMIGETRPTGSISVSSIPTGAKIYLNDTYKGETNRILLYLDPGAYTVKVTMAGFKDMLKAVTVRAGKTTNVNFPLIPIGEAKGEITLCNINGSSCPNCGEATPDDEISVIAEMRNVGTVKGKFMFYVLDQHGNELSKAGGIGYKDVDAGETWKVTPASWDDLDFKMPSSAIIEGHLKLARLE